MNTFPRNSKHLGHLISALNQHYCCAEDGGQLVYSLGLDTEVLACINDPSHTGLAENKEWLARDRVFTTCAGSGLNGFVEFGLHDEFLERAIRAKNTRIKLAMFGENDE